VTTSKRRQAESTGSDSGPSSQVGCGETRTFPFSGIDSAGDVRLAALKIRRFEILDEIGRGGHGIVFRANDRVLQRLVALKLPRPEVLRSKEMRRRFVAEAQVVAALDHPNIIKVFDAGFAATVCYIAQELCNGPSLAAWLKERSTTIRADVAASVMLALARGLEHAHQRGVLHRDLKPANVLLKPHTGNPADSGWDLSAELDATSMLFPYTPKLGDFGICKAFDANPDETATRTGMVLGTAAYMAPEQAVGKASEVGPQSDVYSLGAILYEMLTGHPPFQSDSSAEILRQVLIEEPATLRETRRDVPPALEAICLKCLEKSTARRYATAAELAEDLRRFLVGEPVRAPRKRGLKSLVNAVGRPRRSIAIAFALTGWLLVFVALGFYPRSPQSGSDSVASVAEEDSEAAVTADVRSAFNLWHENAERLRDNPTVSDEMASLLARHIPKAGEFDRRGFDWHYAWRLCHPAEAVGTLTRLASFKAHATDAYFVTFSRDGSCFATCGRDRTARVWETKTGAPVCVCTGHTDEVNWVDFSPDQHWLATASDDHSIRIWDATTGKEQFRLMGHKSSVVAVRFNPNGETLASGDHQGVLKLWSFLSRSVLKSKPDAHQGRIQCLAWGASGHLLASIGNDNAIRLWEMPEMGFRCERRTTEGQCASFSPIGDLIACGGSGTIEIDDIHTGGRYATFSEHHGAIESIVFSPDGRQLASCDGQGVLRLWDLASRRGWNAAPVRYRTPALDSKEPGGVGLWCVAYSPDGTRIATTARDGTVEIWDAAITPQWTQVSKNESEQQQVPLVFAPDGKRVAIARRCPNSLQSSLQIWDVSSTHPTLLRDLAGLNARAACFSRDGKELVVAAPGKVEIYNAKTCESRLRIPLPNGVANAVAFDGRGSLLVLQESNKKWAIHALDAQTGAKVRTFTDPLFERNGVSENGFAVSADGNLLAIDPARCTHAIVFDLSTEQRLPSRPGRRGASGHAQFAPFGDGLAISTWGGVELWDARTGKEQAFLSGLGRFAGPIAFSADGRLLAVVSQEQRAVHLLDVQRRNQLCTLPLPANAACHGKYWYVAVSPDGRQIACSMADEFGNGGLYLYSATLSESAVRDNASPPLEETLANGRD
jgi:WD40 repeat protein/serine/threonine protein kinase